MTVTYDRVECYRSERVAKFFAERSNGTYIGFIKKPTSYTIINNTYQDVQAGSYVVVWEKDKCN